MLLSKILDGVEILSEYQDCDILDITNNSKCNLKNKLFFCIQGEKFDGHDYAQEAILKGALAVVSQKDLGIENQIIVQDTKKAYAVACSHYFNDAHKNVKLIAITGTNGKTSVATITAHILNQSQIKTGLISTIKATALDYEKYIDNTTPDAYTLHQIISDMYLLGCEVICMEASSHALKQERLYGLTFEVGAFTNLTQDHLDYHKTMQDYFESKKKLFSQSKIGIVNIDDDYGKKIFEQFNGIQTFSCATKESDYYAKDITYKNVGVDYTFCYKSIETKIHFDVPGLHFVKNSLLAIAICMNMGASITSIRNSLLEFKGVSGRSEIIEFNDKFTVICDYAHTPDGLENIINSVKAYCNGKVIVLFGCGGDRDKSKRALMGEKATMLADFTVITSDNPRTENPKLIINDILKGAKIDKNYIAIENRNDAIKYAISIAKQGDVILLCGKGHEDYIQIADKKLYYSEKSIIKHAISQL
ncbi:MAG: UDP-N-acetylmuramoyl-L-alanyl-D-glutamate--2,6-diaminopimelate ligase [Oscillospiraceae bacterium]